MTRPPESAWRNLAGSVRRFLSSIVCSNSPRSIGPLRPTLNHYPPLRNPFRPHLTLVLPAAFQAMMEVVHVPPFERFYEEQREPVLGQLRRMLGRDAADDAFQETFLRALRAYPTLEHGRHLRAWALTIARNVALDALRRTIRTSADVPDLESVDEPLKYEELKDLTSALPHKERVAVFLRYGYDLSYDDIGAAIGSSSEAARQAASSGVRRLRRKELR